MKKIKFIVFVLLIIFLSHLGSIHLKNDSTKYESIREDHLPYTHLDFNNLESAKIVNACQSQICPTYSDYRTAINHFIQDIDGIEIPPEDLEEIKDAKIFHPLVQNLDLVFGQKIEDLQVLSSNTYTFEDSKGNNWIHGAGRGLDFNLVLYQFVNLTDLENYVIQVFGIDFKEVYISDTDEVYAIVGPLFDLYPDGTEEFSGEKVIQFDLEDLEKIEKDLNYIY